MAIDRGHVMRSNMRLINKITSSIFLDADKSWERVYSSFCKQQAELNHDTVMQFKYKGKLYHLAEDVALRSGVKPLHRELEHEFANAYAMFVSEVDEEKRVLQNMLAHAIRIAKYSEDLIEILPEIMHEAIAEAGFFQQEEKPYMSVEDANIFKEAYGKYFDMFDLRKTVGALM